MFNAIIAGPLTALAMAGPIQSPMPEIQQTGFIDGEGASERINFSGKLRMLSQRIPAAACNVSAGIAPEDSQAMLVAATQEFDRIIAALEFGDDELGIVGEETDRRTLMDIATVNEVWVPLFTQVQAAADRGVSLQDAISIASQSHEVLARAKHLVSTETAEYTDPTELLAADAIVIDIAGRQRMLAQRISKNACLAASGIEVDTSVAEMSGAMETYAVSMMALRNGLPEAGISAPPTPEIEAGMDEIIREWTLAQPTLEAIKAGRSVSDDERTAIFHGMNRLTGKMNVLVGLYSDASKLGL